MKAATLPLGLTLFFASASFVLAQAPAQETAVNEAVIRQADRIALRQKLADARATQERGDLLKSAKLYDDAWELVQRVGANVDAEAAMARWGPPPTTPSSTRAGCTSTSPAPSAARRSPTSRR